MHKRKGRGKSSTKQSNSGQIEASEPSTSHGLERHRSDKSTKSEDSRRRTIILEKKNGSFGFTIQSFGIHFKKEQEIEMISYVDSIDFNGSAARAGMREGDVILSINGVDVENVDHSTLINFIQNCENRMRMVVLFEDCVRKVELQRQYIELVNAIKEREDEFAELEKLEQSILNNVQGVDKELEKLADLDISQGKWKTHSLPSQRKKPSKEDSLDSTIKIDGIKYSLCRPTLSSEDVANKNKTIDKKNNTSIEITNNTINRSNTYMINNSDTYVIPSEVELKKCTKSTKCNPCFQSEDIEAYDLASPCCRPHCVPRRSSCRNKLDGTKYKKSQSSQTKAINNIPYHPGFENVDKSSNSSEISILETAIDSSNSYTTSLSSDTLFWEVNATSTPNSRPCQAKLNQSSQNKPESRDNFTIKAFGGYGFGYGYSTNKIQNQKIFNRSNSATKAENLPSTSQKNLSQDKAKKCVPTKSTENLLVDNQDISITEPSISCDCLNFIRPDAALQLKDRLLARESGRAILNPTNAREMAYYSQHIPRSQIVLKSIRKRRSNSAEITRL